MCFSRPTKVRISLSLVSFLFSRRKVLLLFLIASICEEKIKDFDQAKKYFKTILFDHKGSLYAAESRKRFRKLAGNTNEKIEKDSG